MRPLTRYLARLVIFAAVNAVALFVMFRLGASLPELARIQGAGMLFGAISPTLTEWFLGNSDLMAKIRATSPRYALANWARLTEQAVFGVVGLALLLWAS